MSACNSRTVLFQDFLFDRGAVGKAGQPSRAHFSELVTPQHVGSGNTRKGRGLGDRLLDGGPGLRFQDRIERSFDDDLLGTRYQFSHRREWC